MYYVWALTRKLGLIHSYVWNQWVIVNILWLIDSFTKIASVNLMKNKAEVLKRVSILKLWCDERIAKLRKKSAQQKKLNLCVL